MRRSSQVSQVSHASLSTHPHLLGVSSASLVEQPPGLSQVGVGNGLQELADLERWFMEASSQANAGTSLVEEEGCQEPEVGFVD